MSQGQLYDTYSKSTRIKTGLKKERNSQKPKKVKLRNVIKIPDQNEPDQ